MSRRGRVLLTAAVASAFALRLWLAAALPLVDDEAYYWTWARRPAAGYPDHPPAVAWMIRATTALLGDGALGVRAGPLLLSAANTLLLYDLGRRMYGPAAGAAAAALYQVIPAFTLGGLFAFPDAPFVFCWLLALWALWRARTEDARWAWYLAGAALGLAALSKLHAVFLAASMAGFVLRTSTERPWRRRPEPYRAAAIALLLFLPVIFWNAGHDWMTLRRARDPAPWIDTGRPVVDAAAFLAAQLAYYGLLTGPLLVAALAVLGTRPYRRDMRSVFLLWGAMPILAATWLASFAGLPKPHWHAPGFAVALIAAGAGWERIRHDRLWRRAAVLAVAINVAVIAALSALPFYPGYAGAGRIWGWDQVAARTEALLRATPDRPGRFVLLLRYQAAGQMEYHLRRRHLVVTPLQRDAYAVWIDEGALLGWNAVVVEDAPTWPPLALPGLFERVERLDDIEVVWHGRSVRRFAVYRGFGFLGLPASVRGRL